MIDKDPFQQLEQWFCNGTLSLRDVSIAYRSAVKKKSNKKSVADLLAGKKHTGGMIDALIQIIQQIEGDMEVAFLRGKQSNTLDK